MTLSNASQEAAHSIVSSAGWKALVDTLHEAAERVVFSDQKVDSPLLRAEGLRYLCRLFTIGAMTRVEVSDPAYPHFVRMEGPWLSWGYPDPSYDYLYAPVHPDYEYRIHGHRGTAYMLNVETFQGSFGHVESLRPFSARTHFASGASVRAMPRTDDLAIGSDGEVEIILGAHKQGGNWVPLPAAPAFVLVRIGYYDWDTEQAPDLFIERLGARYPAPPPDINDLGSRLELLEDWLESVPAGMQQWVAHQCAGPPNTVDFPPLSLGPDDFQHQQGKIGQYYARGHFACGPDEAVILETEVPPGPYWMYQLLSPFFEALDWSQRQVSINGHQAVLDDDGLFRAVIAHRDPGVPNWLDTVGHTAGLIGGRQQYFDVDTPPVVPDLRVVPFDQIRDVLPETTPRVTSGERAASAYRRMLAVQRRKYY